MPSKPNPSPARRHISTAGAYKQGSSSQRPVYRAPDNARPTVSSPKTVYRAPGSPAAARSAGQPATRPAARPRGGAARTTGRVGALLGTLLAFLLALALGACLIFCKGPSPTARDLFVNTMLETSALKFVPRLFLSSGEIDAIVERNSVAETSETTDTSQGEFRPPTDKPLDTIEIEDVHGPTYQGKMMIVYDPSRIQLACLDQFSSSGKGKKLAEFVEEAGAVGGINAGGFADENGMGSGGMPIGLVIRDGEMLMGQAGGSYSVIGFDGNDRLHVGQMTGAEAMERGLRDAVSFGPAFIINGEPVDVTGSGGGLNPRMVMGQREDGAVLLLTIDGRQPHSLGANYQDCIKVMQDYGAVNAANLDGGSSSQMIYQGETINVCSSLYGPRNLPVAWLVQ